MAFDDSRLNIALDTLGGGALRMACYETADELSTVISSGHLQHAARKGLRVGDLVVVRFETTNEHRLFTVSSVDLAGHVTITPDVSDTVNVADFGARGDGTTGFDSLPAFNAAVAKIPAGKTGRVFIPRSAGAYYLSGAVTVSGGRNITFDMEEGADIIGGPAVKFPWPTRFVWQPGPTVRHEESHGTNDPAQGDTIHSYEVISNLGPNPAVGKRLDYASRFYGDGFDLGTAIICTWNRNAGQDLGAMFARWTVAISPDQGGAGTTWSTMCEEYNWTNRYADTGWSETRSSLGNWCGGIQLVPEAATFGAGGTTYNSLFHMAICHSGSLKADGIPAQCWNGILGEHGAIAGGGYFIYTTGRDPIKDNWAGYTDPKAVLGAAGNWTYGFKLNAATFSGQQAVALGKTHRIAWLDANDTTLSELYRGKVTTTNPNDSDDSVQGYGPSSQWVNTATRETFVCLDATPGAAVWQPVRANSPTYSGLTVSKVGSAADATFAVAGEAGHGRVVQFLTGATLRWALGASVSPETGSNLGSRFEIYSYADDGSFLGTRLGIHRATGNVGIGTDPLSTADYRLNVAGHVFPSTDNAYSSGTPGHRWSTVYGATLTPSAYTVATLPTPGTPGRIAYASDGRAFDGAGIQEGAGSGTGCLVTDNGTAWKIVGTNVTVSA